jgi:hypothetical protein
LRQSLPVLHPSLKDRAYDPKIKYRLCLGKTSQTAQSVG